MYFLWNGVQEMKDSSFYKKNTNLVICFARDICFYRNSNQIRPLIYLPVPTSVLPSFDTKPLTVRILIPL